MTKQQLFGKKIKELRLKNGWSQSQFCKMVLYEVSNLSNVENGRRNVSKGVLLLWVKVLAPETEIETFKELTKILS